MSDEPINGPGSTEQEILGVLLGAEPVRLIARLSAAPSLASIEIQVKAAWLVNKYANRFPNDCVAAAKAALERIGASTDPNAPEPKLATLIIIAEPGDDPGDGGPNVEH